MATVIREFYARNKLTGDPIFTKSKRTAVTGTGSLALQTRTVFVLITTDSSTLTVNLEGSPGAGDLPPAARGIFQMDMGDGGQGNTLYYANAGS